MKAAITPEIMEKVWKLYKKSIDAHLIAETLGISYTSASRVIRIMETAENGGDIDAMGNNHQRQKAFAKKYFGIEEKESKQPSEEEVADDNKSEKKAADENNVSVFMVRVLYALERSNELLEKLCAEWGIEKND